MLQLTTCPKCGVRDVLIDRVIEVEVLEAFTVIAVRCTECERSMLLEVPSDYETRGVIDTSKNGSTSIMSPSC